MYYAINLLESITLFYLSALYSNTKKKPGVIDLVFIISDTIIISSIPDNNQLLIFILSLTAQFLYFFIFKFKCKISGLFMLMLCFLSSYFFQLIAAIFMWFFPLPDNQKIQGLIGCSLAFLIIIISGHIFNFYKLFNLIVSSKTIYKMILIYSYLVHVFILLLIKINFVILTRDIILISTVAVLFLISNIYLICNERKNQIQNTELSMYKKNLPIYETLINDVRSNQHEYNNHLQTLMSLPIYYKDYPSLVSALEKYGNSYSKQNHIYPLLTINMPLLAATLYNLNTKANSKGINVMFDIASNSIHSKASEIQLADICSIILQNAIDECKQTDFIYVYISSYDNTMRFEVRNTCQKVFTPSEISNFFNEGYSTKREKKEHNLPHGYGLHYAKKIVNSYDGLIGGKSFELDLKKWMLIFFEV